MCSQQLLRTFPRSFRATSSFRQWPSLVANSEVVPAPSNSRSFQRGEHVSHCPQRSPLVLWSKFEGSDNERSSGGNANIYGNSLVTVGCVVARELSSRPALCRYCSIYARTTLASSKGRLVRSGEWCMYHWEMGLVAGVMHAPPTTTSFALQHTHPRERDTSKHSFTHAGGKRRRRGK